MNKLLAIWVGKTALFFSRLFKAGSGTTLPGLLALIIDPNIIHKLTKHMKNGVIIVTGTNGKTTVSKMLTEIMEEEGFKVLHNPSGSNMTRGVASALIGSVNIFGFGRRHDMAVLEIDEATMPEATSKIKPSIVVVTNLFRDQLDRYGELDKTAALIGKSLRGFPDVKVILNADDPLVSSLAEYVNGEVLYFGLTDKNIAAKSTAAMDSKDCIKCGHDLHYEERYFGHLGNWICPNCQTKRAVPNYTASNIGLDPKSVKFDFLATNEKPMTVTMSIPGLYNIYNALAAAAVAEAAGAGGPSIGRALTNFSAAFGRMEIIKVNSQDAMIILVKNPTGASQALEAVFIDDKPKKILFILNDNFADGTDVSWIWDIDLESFNMDDNTIICSGIRAEDIGLRFKYAGANPKNIYLEKDPISAIEKVAKMAVPNEMIYVFPTYTAMMEIRSRFAPKNDVLAELGKVNKKGF